MPQPSVAADTPAGARAEKRVARCRGETVAPGRRPRLRPGTLDEALAGTPDSVTLFGRDWRILFLNQRAAELLGASREALLGRNLWEMYSGGATGQAYDEFHRALRDQVSVVFEQLSPNAGRVLQCHALPYFAAFRGAGQ